MRLVLTGGGTGGHVYPGLALVEAFRLEPAFAPLDVLFVGTRDRMEARIVPQAGVPIAFVRSAPLVRKLSFALVKTALANAYGFLQSLGVLHRARPDVLIATGGYVALPVVLAQRFVRLIGRSRAKIALLEPNVRSGLTNRLLAPLADEVWYGVAPLGRALRAREHVVGTPVRAGLRLGGEAGEARASLGLQRDRTTVVFIGGSQGAHTLNEAVIAFALSGVPPGLQLLLVAGTRDYSSASDRLAGTEGVIVSSYLDDPGVAYAAADVVVARAGASTLAELAATAKPALLVPYPHATNDHQTHNARAYAASGAARVVTDAELSATTLRTLLAEMLDTRALDTMRTAARALETREPCAAIVARVKTWSPANEVDP